jgi:hypothetical protein
MLLAEELAALVDRDSIELGPSGLEACTLVNHSPEAMASAVGHPGWSSVRALSFRGPEVAAAVGSRRIDIVLHPVMRRLLELRGLTWPELSQLCKSALALGLVTVGFRWQHGGHVPRRLATTLSLPRLKELEISVTSADEDVGRMFLQLRDVGRPLERMVITTRTRLGSARDLELHVTWRDGAPAVTCVWRRQPTDPSEADAVASGFGLPPPSPGSDCSRP